MLFRSDTLNAILAQNKILTQQVNMISQSMSGMQAATGSTKEASSKEEAYDPENPAMEEVNYMGEPYENTYNPSWRNHPNLSWKDKKRPQQGFNNNNGGRNRFSNSKPFPSSSQQQTERFSAVRYFSPTRSSERLNRKEKPGKRMA